MSDVSFDIDAAIASCEAQVAATQEALAALRSDAGGASVPAVVKDILKAMNRLSAVELREALIAAGVPREKLGATYSYLYTVLGRLLQRREIVRVRDKYQLAEEARTQTTPDEEGSKGTIAEKK